MSIQTHVIELPRKKLISKIQKNKEVHIKAFREAVKAYKIEVAKQLRSLAKLNKSDGNDSLDIELDLVKPIDNRKHYNKLIQRYEWEINEDVILSHNEFNEYVLDENHVSEQANFSNTFYLDSTN